MDFPLAVAPFILRGVTLCGIDLVLAPTRVCLLAWLRLACDLDTAKQVLLSAEIPLEESPRAATELIYGAVRGRRIVDVCA